MALCGTRWSPAGGAGHERASLPDVPLFVAQQGDPEFSRLRRRIHIVCVGDSITGWNNFGSPPNWPYPTYPRFLQLLCSPQGLRVADGGIAGEVSPAGPRHVTRYLSWFANASWFIIGFGTNDLSLANDVPATSGQIIDHMQSMASLVTRQGNQVLFLNVPNVNSSCFPSATAEQLRRDRDYHNGQLADFCESAGIPLVDICSRLQDEHFGDAVHPNETGARIIAETVFDTLSPLLMSERRTRP
jgi:lysophospholipase L1-like esterase